MRLWVGLFTVLGIIGRAKSWNDKGLSNCAKSCVNSGLGLECTSKEKQDECICTSSQLYSYVACCMLMKCDPSDRDAHDNLIKNTCTTPSVTLITDLRACTPTTSLVQSTSMSTPSPSDSNSTNGVSWTGTQRIGAIVGIALGSFCILSVLICAFVYIRRHNRRMAKKNRASFHPVPKVPMQVVTSRMRPDYSPLLHSPSPVSPGIASPGYHPPAPFELEAIPARQSRRPGMINR